MFFVWLYVYDNNNLYCRNCGCKIGIFVVNGIIFLKIVIYFLIKMKIILIINILKVF